MSIRLMAIVWDSALPSDEKIVALALADWADDNGGSLYPSQKHLAWKLGKTERSVRTTIDKLVARGALEVLSVGRAGVSSRYRFIRGGLPSRPPFRPEPEDSSGSAQPEVSDSPTGRNFRLQPEKTSADPSVIRQKDPSDHTQKTRARAKPKRVTEVDDAFRAEMVEKYREHATPDRINDEIDDALGHKAALKRHDHKAYIRTWLARTNWSTHGRDRHDAAGGAGAAPGGYHAGANGRSGVPAGAGGSRSLARPQTTDVFDAF